MSETEVKRCLHCDQTKVQIQRDNTICGIEGGYEYVELEHEWANHRWADWKDADLEAFGILPPFFDHYRRQQITQFQYLPCDHTARGHNFAQQNISEPEFGIRKGQCWGCGQMKGAPQWPQTR